MLAVACCCCCLARWCVSSFVILDVDQLIGCMQHLVIDIIRIVEGFIYLPAAYPGGRIRYFSEVSQWTFVTKNYVYAAQTLVGDGVVVSLRWVQRNPIR